MRNSKLPAVVFAMLIIAALAFVAGYYVGTGNTAAAPAPQPVAGLETDLPDTDVGAGKEQQPGANQREPQADTPDTPTHSGPSVADPDSPVNDSPRPATDAPAASRDAEVDTERDAEVDADPDEDVIRFREGPKIDFSTTITGRVLDSNGTPVAGASVKANVSEEYNAESGARRSSLVLADGSRGGKTVATTDATGTFNATFNRKVNEGNGLRIELSAGAEGFADSKRQTVHVKNGENRDGVELTLRKPGTVTGRVVDTHGAGAGGVTISLRERGGGIGQGDLSDIELVIFGAPDIGPYSAVTDAAGEYTITGVPEGGYEFKLHGTGFKQVSGPTQIDVQAEGHHRAAADFIVAVTASLRIRLAHADDKAIRGWGNLALVDDAGQIARSATGMTNATGVFELNNPPVGSYEVRITLSGYKPRTLRATIIEGQPLDLGTVILERDPLPVGD